MKLERASFFPTMKRRELLRVGGISVTGGFLSTLFRPHNVFAQGRMQPLATANKIIFIMLDGGLSHVDSFDLKEGKWTPPEFEPKSFGNDLKLPVGLFKHLPSLLDKVAVVRSLNAWDAVHGRAQYYLQTGHPLNLALAKEVPSLGSVICHEMAKYRKEGDSLPAFVALNAISSQAGLIRQGFLSAEYGPMSLSVADGAPDLTPDAGTEETFHRRWELLQKLDKSLRSGDMDRGRNLPDYQEYYRSAYAMMSDPRVPEVFKINAEEKQRYGNSPIGNSLILARNLVQANAGTRFVLAGHPGWDFHTNIYDGRKSHQVLSRQLDVAYFHLLTDLGSTPSSTDKTKTLLDETLVVCMSEFGRTPGPLTESRLGREHYMWASCGLLAGGGVKGGQVLGKTDEDGAKVVDPGWSANRPIYMEDIAITMYSALGISWNKTIRNTPSGRSFHYVEPASGTQYVAFKPVIELFT
jgi:hypothetical protein